MKSKTTTLWLVIITLVLGSVALAQTPKDTNKSKVEPPKITIAELIKNHLASIGTPEAIAAARSRVMVGTGSVAGGVGYSGKLGGPAQFASDGDNVLFAIIFNSNDYRYEKVGFDGKDITFGHPGGGTTHLSDFLKSNKGVVKQGLFGGVLSSAWPLLKASKDVKLESAGSAEIGGRLYYKAKVTASAVSGMAIVFFFDAENFHHVMSSYTYDVAPRLGMNVSDPNVSKPTYYSMTERFSNFSKAGDLVLPLTYTIDVAIQAPEETKSLTWVSNFAQVYFNETLDPAVFKVS